MEGAGCRVGAMCRVECRVGDAGWRVQGEGCSVEGAGCRMEDLS